MRRDGRNVVGQAAYDRKLSTKVSAAGLSERDHARGGRKGKPSLARRVAAGDYDRHRVKEGPDRGNLEGKSSARVPLPVGVLPALLEGDGAQPDAKASHWLS